MADDRIRIRAPEPLRRAFEERARSEGLTLTKAGILALKAWSWGEKERLEKKIKKLEKGLILATEVRHEEAEEGKAEYCPALSRRVLEKVRGHRWEVFNHLRAFKESGKVDLHALRQKEEELVDEVESILRL